MKKIISVLLLAFVLNVNAPGVWAKEPSASPEEKSVEFKPEGKGGLQVLYRMAPFEGAYGSLRFSTMENQIQWECYTDDNTKAVIVSGDKKESVDLNLLWKWTGNINAATSRYYDNYSFSKESMKDFTHRDHTKHNMPEKGKLCVSSEIFVEAEEKAAGDEVPAWMKQYNSPQ